MAISVPPSSLGALRCGYSLCADWYQSWLWRHCCCRALLSPQPPPRLWRIFLQHRKLSSIAPMIWSCGSIRLLELIITGASVGTARPRAARMFAATRPIRQGCGRREMRSERVADPWQRGSREVRTTQPVRSRSLLGDYTTSPSLKRTGRPEPLQRGGCSRAALACNSISLRRVSSRISVSRRVPSVRLGRAPLLQQGSLGSTVGAVPRASGFATE